MNANINWIPNPKRISLCSFVIVIATLFLFALPISAGEKKKSRPNIILIMADDLGYGDPGFMGNKRIKTPALDAMAKNGLVFTRFYSAAPVCSPTRASCLTGRHPYRMGITFANVGHLPEREITLPRVLRLNGYTTGHFGKWHLGTLTKTEQDSNRGGPRGAKHYAPPWERHFDTYFSTEAKVPTWNPMKKPGTNKYYGTAYWKGPGEKATENLDGDDSRVIMDRAIPFIQNAARKKTPFLAVIWFHTPHLPVVGGPKYLEMYKDFSGEKDKHYCACITAMDDQVGRLRAELRKLGIADNTMIWFCSDNGPEGNTNAPGSTGGLRGRKRSLLEGGIRVPGILEWPAMVKPGQKTKVPACTSDYLPTILSVLNQPILKERPIDGINLLPIVQGKIKERPRPIAFKSGRQRALIDNRYSLYKSKRGKSWELYDLLKDPGQKKNIAADNQRLVEERVLIYHRWEESVNESWEKLKK